MKDVIEKKPLIVLLAELCEKRGESPIKDKVWSLKLDEHWWFAVNGCLDEQTVVGDSGCATKVQPFHCFVEFNGWPAGIFGPEGGQFAAGCAANEEKFAEALELALDGGKS